MNVTYAVNPQQEEVIQALANVVNAHTELLNVLVTQPNNTELIESLRKASDLFDNDDYVDLINNANAAIGLQNEKDDIAAMDKLSGYKSTKFEIPEQQLHASSVEDVNDIIDNQKIVDLYIQDIFPRGSRVFVREYPSDPNPSKATVMEYRNIPTAKNEDTDTLIRYDDGRVLWVRGQQLEGENIEVVLGNPEYSNLMERPVQSLLPPEAHEAIINTVDPSAANSESFGHLVAHAIATQNDTGRVDGLGDGSPLDDLDHSYLPEGTTSEEIIEATQKFFETPEGYLESRIKASRPVRAEGYCIGSTTDRPVQ